MSHPVDYKQLRMFVREALGPAADGPGGSMTPSAPADVPHRMPAAEPSKEMGDPRANELYDVALIAREATEKLVEALDDPVFDDAYEHAFKATASLRRVLNSLISSGAHPDPEQHVVAPPRYQQRYGAGPGNYSTSPSIGGGVTDGVIGLEEGESEK